MEVYKFVIPKICPVLGSFFQVGIISQVVVVIGWEAGDGLNIV